MTYFYHLWQILNFKICLIYVNFVEWLTIQADQDMSMQLASINYIVDTQQHIQTKAQKCNKLVVVDSPPGSCPWVDLQASHHQ